MAGPGWGEEFGVLLLGVEELGVPLPGVELRSGPPPVDGDGDGVGVLVEGDAALGGVDWEGFWFGLVVLGFWPGVWVRLPPVESVLLRGGVRSPGVVPGLVRGPVPSFGVAVPGLLRGGVRSPGVVPGVFRGVLPSPGVVVPGRWAGIRPSGVPCEPGVRPSPTPGTRPSGVEAGVLRGVVGDVGLGVEAGPVPVAEGVPGVPEEGFLAGPELGFGLVADGVPAPPEDPGVWCPPGAGPPVEGAVGDVCMPPPPSERPPELAGEGSAVVGVGAALDCVGALAARLSIWVPSEPPPGEDDGPPDDADPGAGVDCGLGDDSPDTGEPPPECEGPDVLGVLDEPLDSEPLESEPLDEGLPDKGLSDDGPPEEGSSKSDRDGPAEGVGLEYGLSEEDGFPESEPGPEPESGPGPILGAGMSAPPVSADMPLPMLAPGMLPLPERVELEESDPDELESEDDELEDEESEEDESVEDESEDEESDDEESEEDESDDEEDEELELPGPESLPMSPPDGPSYPSIRLSTACRARLPAFWPRLSRMPSAKVCGLCLRASRPASPPAFMVAPMS